MVGKGGFVEENLVKNMLLVKAWSGGGGEVWTSELEGTQNSGSTIHEVLCLVRCNSKQSYEY